MRVVLTAIGLLIAIAAIGSTIGFASSLLSGEGPESVGEWLGCIALQAVLYALAAGILYLASRSARRERLRQLAEERDRANRGSVSFVCSQCGDTNLVQGPMGWGCVARCLTCGQRTRCSEDIWDQLPESALGDAYQTIDDVRDHMVRDPMTRGQLVVCALGVCAGITGTACLIDSFLAAPAFLASNCRRLVAGTPILPTGQESGHSLC